MRILVVEDEVTMATVLKKGLTAEGFVVDVAHDGISGQWLAQQNPYDVIMLDIMLPGRNGYDVLENLRSQDIWTPVLMLTAKDGEYDQSDAFDLGADDYLSKPFSFVVLTARLRALIRRGAPQRPAVLHVGSLMLDPAKRAVTRHEEPISLTAKEFALLHFLTRHGDEVVTKAEILDNVWGADFEGRDNIIEIYIGYLRKKIDVPFGVQSLVTLRGQGYSLRSVE